MKKVLVIDDEKDFCFFLKKNLELSGNFEVDFSYDGKVGIEKARQISPDIILLDIMMPNITGPVVAEELMGNKETKDIPIIFLTAIVREKEAQVNNNLIGGWHYLSKPVQMEELLNMVNLLTA